MNEEKGHQILKQITKELQEDKRTSKCSCPNRLFELPRPNEFFKILWKREGVQMLDEWSVQIRAWLI